MADGSVKIDTKIDTKGVPGQLKNLGSVLKTGIASAAKVAGIALGAVTAAVGALGAASIGAASRMEDIKAAFIPLTGSAENAEKMINALNKEAAKTPHTLNEIADVSKQLLPVIGNDVDGITEAFRMLGDTAGGNTQKLDSITRGYVKTLSMGKVSMEALNMISDAGVPIQSQLAKNMNVTVEELYSMVSAGKVTSEELTKTFRTMTSEGGLFFNGMEIASQTFSGRVSTAKDSLEQLARALGEYLMPYAKAALEWFIDFAAWGLENDRIAKTLNATFIFLGQVVSATFSFIKKAIGEVWIAWANIVTFFQTTGHRIGGLFQNIGSTISLVFTIAFNSVKIALISFYELLTTKILGGVRTFLDVLGKLPFVGEQFNAASAAIGRVTDAITDNVDAVKQASLDKIKAVAEERIATREAVDENIENVRREGDERISEARRVAEAIERFSFNLKPTGDGEEEESSSPVNIVTSTSDWASSWKGLKKRGEDAGQITVESIRKGIFDHLSTATRAAKEAVIQIGAAVSGALRISKTVISKAATIIQNIAFFDPQAMLASFKELLDGIPNFFLVDLPLLPVYFDAGVKILNDFINGIMSNMGAIVKTIGNVIIYMAKKIETEGPEVIAGIVQIIIDVAIAIIENLPIILKAAIKLITVLAIEIAKRSDVIIEAVLSVLPEIIKAIIDSIPDMLAAVARYTYELWRGVILGILGFGKNVFAAVSSVFENFWNSVLAFFGINSPSTLGINLGFNIIQGIVNGLLNFGAGIWDAVKGIFTGLWDKIVDVFSGSIDLGRSIVDGITGGITGFFEGVGDVASDLWDGITGWFASGTNSAPRGLAMVGENGPELVQLNGGERIYPANETARILSAGAGVLSSISNGMNTGGGMITLINKMTGTVNVDGREIGRIAYENLDRFALS